MENRRGSTFILTLIVLVVLSVLATGTISFMVSENNQSLAHKNNIEAYYIARSGAEAAESAILKLDQDELEELEGKFGEAENKELSIGIKGMEFENEGEIIEAKLKMDDEENLIIKSTGQVDWQTETVEKVLKENSDVCEDGELEFEYPIYASENLIVGEDDENDDDDDEDDDDEDECIIIDIKPEINPETGRKTTLGCKNLYIDDDYNSKCKKDIRDKVEENVNNKLNDNITIDIPKININEKKIEKENIFNNDWKNEIITKKEFKEKLRNNNFPPGINYYVEGDVEIEVEGAFVIHSNIYSNDEIDIESTGSMEINGDIVSNYEIDIESTGSIKINGDIASNYEIDIESDGSVMVNGNIISNYIDDDDDEAIEIEFKGDLHIIGSLYAPRGDIEIEMESENGKLKLEEGVIIGRNVELDIEDGGIIEIRNHHRANIDNFIDKIDPDKSYSPGYYR